MSENMAVATAGNFHVACTAVDAAASDVVTYLRTGINLSHWLVDQPRVVEIEPDLFETSFADRRYVRITAREANAIYFHVGQHRDDMQRRIMIAVHEGLDSQDSACLVNMVAWRVDGMTDRRWRELCHRHEMEIGTLKEILEMRFRRGTPGCKIP